MNVRLTILLVVVVAIAGGAWAVIEFSGIVSRGEAPPDKPWLYHIDEADITYISVAHGGPPVEYRRDAASRQWLILGDPDYPVFAHRWGGTPLLLSGPRVNRGLKETITDPAQYGLDPPASVVRVADWAGNAVEFHLGRPTPDGANQYARLVGDNALYTLPASWAAVVNRLADDPPYGRLFDLDPGIITAVQVTAGESTAVYYLDNGQWRVHPNPPPVNPENSTPASSQWPQWLTTIAAPRIDQVIEQQVRDRDEEKLAEYGLDNPAVRIVIARRAQSTIEFLLGAPTPNESYYARTINNNDERIYAIKKSRLPGIADLAQNPLTQPDEPPPPTATPEN